MGLIVSQQKPTKTMVLDGKTYYLLKNVYDTKDKPVKNLWGSPITVIDSYIYYPPSFPDDGVVGFNTFLTNPDGTQLSYVESHRFSHSRYVWFDSKYGEISDYETKEIKYKFKYNPLAPTKFLVLNYFW